MSLTKPCDDGTQKDESEQFTQKEDIVDTSTMPNNRSNKNKSSTPESLPINKLLILNDKSLSCKKDFPVSKSLEISALASTLNAKDCSAYWSSSSKEISNTLWLPIKTDYVVLDSNFSNTSSSNMEPFLQSLKQVASKNLSQTSQQTSYQSLLFLQQDITDPEVTKYCRKIRIYPNKEQVELFNKCLGANRFFYNKANEFVKPKYQEAKTKRIRELEALDHCGYCDKPKVADSFFCEKHQGKTLGIDYSYLNRITIRDAILASEDDLTPDIMWQKEIPYDTKQLAIDQLRAAYSSAFALRKRGLIDTFEIHNKKKKVVNQIFQVNKKAINFEKMVIFVKKVKKKFRVRKRDLEMLKEGADCNVTVLKTRPNKWYFCLPREREPSDKEPAPFKSVFLDPGARTFMTYYSPDGVAGKIGDNYAADYISPLAQRIDMFESLRSTSESIRTRRNIRRRLYKLRAKATNRVTDLHWKTCKYLCDSFDTIILPPFRVSEMVEKTPRRVISSKTVRSLLALSHCRFRERLSYYAKTKHRNLIIASEAHTTKTCGNCGNSQEVGGSKVYKCNCGYEIDRDYHGARNIAIRLLS